MHHAHAERNPDELLGGKSSIVLTSDESLDVKLGGHIDTLLR